MQVLEGNNLHKDYWLRIQNSSFYASWAGYTFEGICIKNLSKIVSGLGLDVVATSASGWSYLPKNSEEIGAQIDLVISRTDNCINLCQIKFCNDEFILDKGYAMSLVHKKTQFRHVLKKRKKSTLPSNLAIFFLT